MASGAGALAPSGLDGMLGGSACGMVEAAGLLDVAPPLRSSSFSFLLLLPTLPSRLCRTRERRELGRGAHVSARAPEAGRFNGWGRHEGAFNIGPSPGLAKSATPS